MKVYGRKLRIGKRLMSLLMAVLLLLEMCPQINASAAEVTLTFKSGATQDNFGRYLLYFEGLGDTADKYWNNNTVYIDGKEVSGDGVHYLHVGSDFALLLYYSAIEQNVTAASGFSGAHTLQIKSGTSLANGEYTVSNDVWLKLNGYEVTQLTPVELTYAGSAVQDWGTRFALTFSGFADTADKYWSGNTVYIDGKAVSGDGVHYLPDSGDNITLYLYYSAITANAATADALGAHTLEIPAGTLLGNYVVAKSLCFQINGSSITQVYTPDITVTLNDDWRNDSGCTDGVWFTTSEADALAYDTANWTTKYSMTTGGIYFNDTLVSGAKLVKVTDTLYYTAFDGCGITFAAGDIVKIAGTVTADGYTVAYTETSFQYDGNGAWDIYTAPVGNKFALDESDPGGWQGNLSRYLVWLTDDISGDKTELGTVQLLIDGVSQNVPTALIGGRYALVLNESCGISALGEHTVQITAGQALGEYTAASDAVFYTHADGSVNTTEGSEPGPTETTEPVTTQPEDKTITLGVAADNPGSWQAEESRYLVWLTDDLTGTRVDPVTVSITVDGEEKTANTGLVNDQFVLLLNENCGITEMGEHTVIIHKDSYFGEYKVTEDVIIYTHADGGITVDSGEPEPTETTEPVTTQPEDKTITLGVQADNPGSWQAEESRYLVWLTDDLTGTRVDPGTVSITVDGVEKTAATGLVNNQFVLLLNADCGITETSDHTIIIHKDSYFGEYKVTEDVIFYTTEAGSVVLDNNTPAPTDKTITLGVQADNPGSWQAEESRYLVWLTDDLTGTRVDPGTVSITVDGVEKTAATGLVNNQFVLLLNADCGITETSDHTIIIHKDSYFGEYKVTEDVIFYTTEAGSVVLDNNTPAPTDKTITLGVQADNPGSWQAEESRYLVWLTDDLTGTRVDPGTVSITVDGVEKTAATGLVNDQFVLLLNADCGITKMGNHTVVIHKGSYFGAYKVTKDLTVYTYADGSVSDQPPVQMPEASETVTIGDDSRNHLGSCDNCIWFTVSPADQLPHNLEADTCKYGASEGGIYFNGELIEGMIIKKLENLYFLNLTAVSPVERGDVVTLDGVFGNADYAIRFEKQSFVYLGDGNWEIGDHVHDLREQKVTVQDISELKMGISEFPLQIGNQTLIGEAVSSTNIAIKTKINLSGNMTEIKFGFSKLNGMWDAEESGWQIALMPGSGEIKMFHDMSALQTMVAYPFADGEYTLEIGSVDVHEYIDDVDQGLYCRKVFLKINGEEVLSYQDTDLSRNLGKKLYVYVSNDVPECKLVSLTSQGVTVRELDPVVYDYYDISGFAGFTAENNSSTCLGAIDSTSNYAVRMRLNSGTKASELKIAIGKVNPEQFWEIEKSGWQLWMRPASGQLFLAHSMDTWEVMTAHGYTDSYIVEFGVKDQVIEKNGKYVSTFCRVLYVKIDGKEIARWEDTNFDRPLGEYVLLYCAGDSETEVSTLNNTTTIPVEIVVNGQTAEQPAYVQVNSKVVVGKPSNINVTVKTDPYYKAILDGVYCNGEKLDHIEQSNGKYTYTLETPQEGDTLKVELTAKELAVDEPVKVFDLFDLSGQATLLVPQATTAHLGMMVDTDGQAAVNSAIRYGITIPAGFNHIPLTILGDNPGLWGNHGAMLEITPGQIHFCHTATSFRLASFSSALFAPGSTVCVEFGVVKCYEEGVYKYDRWYVKAGKTESSMELVGWYDSVERGSYGGHVVCHGVDVGGDYYLYSLKETYSITDVSAQESKDQLCSYAQLQNTLPELYFPGRAEAYADANAAEKPVRIKFFTKPGTSLTKLTVAGEDVTAAVVIGEDGAYCYTLPSLEKDVEFSYEIGQDDTTHSISVDADDNLQVSCSKDSVITGGDVTVSVTARAGFVPTVTVNGADITGRLSLDENTGVWSVTLKSIRADTQIQAASQERNYEILLTQPENGTVTLGGDVLNGQLPFGGRLELILKADEGCYIQGVTVNGKAVAFDSDGTAVLEAIYVDAESLDIQAVFVKSDAKIAEQKADMTANPILWIGIGAVAVIVLVAVVLLSPKKKGKGEDKA